MHQSDKLQYHRLTNMAYLTALFWKKSKLNRTLKHEIDFIFLIKEETQYVMCYFVLCDTIISQLIYSIFVM